MIAPLKNISFVPQNDLCHSCGICSSICPLDCISMVRDEIQDTPTIDFSICTNCDLCVKGCSGYSTNSFDDIKLTDKTSFIGNTLKNFTGYTNNITSRKNSASGGVMTEFASYLLRENKVDGILVTKMGKDGYPESFIAYTQEELEECKGSIYEVNNISKPLKEILQSKDKTFAVMALPCQLESIEKASKSKGRLKKNIKYKISLFCGKTITHKGVDFLLNKTNLERNNKYTYREIPGWATKFGDKNTKIEFWSTFINPGMFELNRCDLCSDFYAKNSDISFGDAWLPEYSSDKDGTSIMIVRNENALEILNEMNNKEIISLNEVTKEKVLESQGLNEYYKFKSIPEKIKLREKLNKKIPYEDLSSSKNNLKSSLYVLRKYIILNYFKNKELNHILKYNKFYMLSIKVLRKLFKEGNR